MQQIPLQEAPNQEFTVILDNNTWVISLKTTNGITAASFALNGVDILDNTLAPAGAFLIPSFYEEAGNFFFVTQNFQLPAYVQFGITQSLIYISAAELAVLRAPPASPYLTAASFNPIAALPLRFKPQGYVEA